MVTKRKKNNHDTNYPFNLFNISLYIRKIIEHFFVEKINFTAKNHPSAYTAYAPGKTTFKAS